MLIKHKNADIIDTDADAILYCDPEDMMAQQKSTFTKAFPSVEAYRVNLYQQRNATGEPVWVPGSVCIQNVGAKQNIIHACLTPEIGGVPEYKDIKTVIDKIIDLYREEKLPIKSFATILIGCKSRQKEVIEKYFEMAFNESPEDYNAGSSFVANIYIYD